MPKVVDHEARRRSLVEASWDVIASEGIEGVTLRKVAAAADCTTGGLTHYFSSRDDLILAVLRSVYADSERRMIAIKETGKNPESRLRDIVYEALPLDSTRLREWRVWIVFWAAAAMSEELSKENARRFDAWQQLLTELIADVAGRDQAKQRAFELASMVDGIGIRICLSSNRKTRAMATTAVDEWVAGFSRA